MQRIKPRYKLVRMERLNNEKEKSTTVGHFKTKKQAEKVRREITADFKSSKIRYIIVER